MWCETEDTVLIRVAAGTGLIHATPIMHGTLAVF